MGSETSYCSDKAGVTVKDPDFGIANGFSFKEINLDDINLSFDSHKEIFLKESNISINQNNNNSIMDIKI